jgi:hypothetical protein
LPCLSDTNVKKIIFDTCLVESADTKGYCAKSLEVVFEVTVIGRKMSDS